MKTWLEDFHVSTDLNKYPIALRTRGGIGYQTPDGVVSNFVGHPVHFFDNGLWKPITLQPHANGDFEGCDFSWKGKQVFYKGKALFAPRAILFNGVRRKLSLRQDGNRIVADLNLGGSPAQYEIIFSESGVKELLTIFEPVEGLLEFDIPHANKPNELHKKDRHIVGGAFGESFQLTAAMDYPLVIDPDYSGDSADGYVYGQNATYATARSTSTAHDAVNPMRVGQYPTGGQFLVLRSFLKFSTAGIPDSDSVSDVIMKLTAVADNSVTDFDVVIRKQDWSGQDPLAAGNREAAFDNCLAATSDSNIWRNTSGMSLNTQYSSGSLDTSWVVKTGSTYYSLISSQDVSNTSPGANDAYIQIASQEYATSAYRPVLTVTHAAAATGDFSPVWFF